MLGPRGEDGATAVEYVLATGLVCLVALGAFALLGESVREDARCAAAAIGGRGAEPDCDAGGASERADRDGAEARSEALSNATPRAERDSFAARSGELLARAGDTGRRFDFGAGFLEDHAGEAWSGASSWATDAKQDVTHSMTIAARVAQRISWMTSPLPSLLMDPHLWREQLAFRAGLVRGAVDWATGTARGIAAIGKAIASRQARAFSALARGDVSTFAVTQTGLDLVDDLPKLWGAFKAIAGAVAHDLETFAVGSPEEAGHAAGSLSMDVATMLVPGGGAVRATRGARAAAATERVLLTRVEVASSHARTAEELVGRGTWKQGAIRRERDGYQLLGESELSTWLRGRASGADATPAPAHMSCSDLLLVTAVRCGAMTPDQALALQEVGLKAADRGHAQAALRSNDIPVYGSDVASDARAAFLFEAMGFSRSTAVGPSTTLSAGDLVFFGRPGDHVAIATGRGRQVVSIWNTGLEHEVELTTIDDLARHFTNRVEPDVPSSVIERHPGRYDRARTDHLAARWNPDQTPSIRKVANPFDDLGRGDVPGATSTAWSATLRIVKQEATSDLVNLLRQRLQDARSR